MTESAYLAAKKLMQRATYIRGLITGAKGEVAKWTAIEDGHRRNLQHGKADGAKKMLDKALVKLEKYRSLFAKLEFPPNDLREEEHRCNLCGRKIHPTETCMCIYE